LPSRTRLLLHISDPVAAVCEGGSATFTGYPDPTGTLALCGDTMLKLVVLGTNTSQTSSAVQTWFREAGLDPAWSNWM
jgi:hypothetical protein